MRTRVALATLFVALLAACGQHKPFIPPPPPGRLPGPAIAAVELGGFPLNLQWVKADIIPLGPSRYVVGWESDTAIFRYTAFELPATRVSTSPLDEASAGAPSEFTIRANTSPALDTIGTCGGGGSAHRFVNFSAVQLGTTVFLDTFTTTIPPCERGVTEPTLKRTRVDDAASRPAVATQGTFAAGRALVVYGKAEQLVGRFVTWSTDATTAEQTQTLGDVFTIAMLPGAAAFTTDVILQRAANAFIVGFVERGNLGNGVCRVQNVVLSADPAQATPAVVRAPVQFGTCDFDLGGHPTSVANAELADGTYLWWRQDENRKKAVFVHDATGALTQAEPFRTDELGGDNWTQLTVPVAATSDASLPYVFLANAASTIRGRTADGAWTCLTCDTPADTPVAVRWFPTALVALTAALDKKGATSQLTVWAAPAP